MSSDSDKSRYVTWKFTHILHTSLGQQATRGLASTKIGPYNVMEQLFLSLIFSTRLPSNAKFIQLRVPRLAFDGFESNARAGAPLPDLPFDGCIQSGQKKLDLDSLKSWIAATWERVNGKLKDPPAFLNGFLKPDDATAAAFVHFQMPGDLAVAKCGRQPKLPAVN